MGAMLIIPLVVLLWICAFIGVDILIRPARYQDGQGGVSLLLNSLAQRALPQMDKALAYRLIGAVVAITAVATVCTVTISSLVPLAQHGNLG